jgi:hypothetical protein
MRPPSLGATQLDLKTFAFIPAALLGAWFGLRIFKRLSDRQFEMAVNALLKIQQWLQASNHLRSSEFHRTPRRS